MVFRNTISFILDRSTVQTAILIFVFIEEESESEYNGILDLVHKL